MDRADVEELYRYDEWANDRILSCVTAVSPDQLLKPLGGSFASLRDTVAHLISAEWIWLERWQGRRPTVLPEWISSPELSVLIENLRRVEAERATFLASLDDASLERIVEFTFFNGNPGRYRLGDLLR